MIKEERDKKREIYIHPAKNAQIQIKEMQTKLVLKNQSTAQ